MTEPSKPKRSMCAGRHLSWRERTLRPLGQGAKFWLAVFTDLQVRGIKDCFVACADWLTGLLDALETIFPRSRVQLCIVQKSDNPCGMWCGESGL